MLSALTKFTEIEFTQNIIALVL